jgi:hypothetical protein
VNAAVYVTTNQMSLTGSNVWEPESAAALWDVVMLGVLDFFHCATLQRSKSWITGEWETIEELVARPFWLSADRGTLSSVVESSLSFFGGLRFWPSLLLHYQTLVITFK